ncbi:MAG: DUF5668 domain-containing protein [Candidatus Dormibacteraeota bacterium]|nr:DUF5668 domain-containing protein [Candidatus Dormibacteraeota bacterium]
MTPPADPALPPPLPSPTPVVTDRPLFWPIVLIGIGVVALLFNTGWLDWEKVARLYRLWPLLLIVLGIAILFRGRLPRRLASLFAAVLLIVAVLAIGGALAALPQAFEGSSTPTETSHFAAATGEITAPHLDLSAGAAQIKVHAGPTGGDLYRATIESPTDEKPHVGLNAGTSTLSVHLPGRTGFHWGNQNDHRTVDLTLNDQLSWAIGLNTGASQTSLGLSGMKISSVSLASGASSVKLLLPKPSGTVPVDVSGGAMHLVIQRAAGTPIRVSSNGGASSLDVDGNHYGGLFHQGQAYASPDYSTATDRYEINIDSGASSIGIS